MSHPLTRNWLADVPWDLVVYQNAALCEAKSAHHGPTSDGYESALKCWEESRGQTMHLFDVVDLCRTCHRLAPFTNFNGNTFAAIARVLIDQLNLSAGRAAVVRSLVGHIVAGVASDQENAAFRSFCEGYRAC